MDKLINKNLPRLKEICEKYQVSELFLFGSALNNDFNENSDLDFTVVFKEHLSPLELGSAFIDLFLELESLFNRKVDLVSYRVIKNAAFKEELDRTKKILYAAA